MRRSSIFRTAALASTIAIVCTIACKEEEPTVLAVDYPGDMAEGYCVAAFSCVCDDYPYANANECFADLVAAYSAVNDSAYIAGLSYDGTCPAKELETIQGLACKGYVPPPPAGICSPPCNVWHGNLTAGYPCQVLASSAELGLAFSNCAQGLVCAAGVCTNPCQGTGPLPSIGQPCAAGLCATGAVCDETTMMCVAAPTLPGPGQPCEAGACNPDTAVCVAAANTCAALPATGQPCIEGQCDLNSYCSVADNICVNKPPLACYLLSGGIPGDGDGDPTTTTGDGDGDGDGDPGACEPTVITSTVPNVWGGDTSANAASFSGSCGGDGPEDVLSYVAPESGIYQFSTEGSTFDTILYLRDGGCAGVELACDDDTIMPASLLEVSLSAGQEVYIFVDSYDVGGTYALMIDLI